MWSRLAARAAEATGGLGDYPEPCEERLLLMLTGGRDATDGLRRLSARIDELTRDYRDELGDAGRGELFAEFADLVDAARAHEEEAVGVLAATA